VGVRRRDRAQGGSAGRLGAVLLHIVARGKIGRSPEAELTERYLKRISWPTRMTELPDRGGTSPEAIANNINVVLDERGKALTSMEFARKLEGWRDTGRR
jgi:23S rRNA (pseudouridine1915-N3)-methyltransferase